jgi:ppGpp synthetase/RelA/SpoT-type nucleotidyltranferase
MTAPASADYLRTHVGRFNAARPVFERVSAILDHTLRALAEPLAPQCEVQSRAKTLSSFAGKLVRKHGKYHDPLIEITDLCGARIVCAYASQTLAVAEVIRQRFGFAIDEANSLDQRSLLRAGEFGYRSIHYVITLGPGSELPDGTRDILWPGLTSDMHGLKVEIQVRTRLQQIWSGMTHDLIYKNPLPLPDTIRREVARIAAEYESLDTDMERIVAQIADFHSHYGPSLTDEQLAEEKRLHSTLREFDPLNPDVPLRQAELALTLDAWPEAIAAITGFITAGGEFTPALEAALGFAQCRAHAEDTKHSDHATGRSHLTSATARDPHQLLAWLRRAECELTPTDAHAAYRQAYRLDPTDPAALAGYVQGHLATTGDARFVDLLRPALHAAVDCCERQIALKIDLPWAHFRAGFFRLLLAEPGEEPTESTRRSPRYESRLNAALRSLVLGVATCRHLSPLRDAWETIETLRTTEPTRADVAIAARLLTLALETRRGGPDLAARLKPHASPLPLPLTPSSTNRVLLVAGSAKLDPGENLADYERVLRTAFADFTGLVISGGTAQGVPGLVGRLARESSDRIVAVGYLPAHVKSTSTSTRSPDYHELRETTGVHFSPLEPLQAWTDLLASGVNPADVTLIALGGGPIAALEYRLALILGARVIVASDSGREAGLLCADPAWLGAEWRLQQRLLINGDWDASGNRCGDATA